MAKLIRNDSENVYNLQGTYRWAAGQTLEVPDEVAAHALEVHPDWFVDVSPGAVHRHSWRVNGECACGAVKDPPPEEGTDAEQSDEPDGDEPAEPDPSEEA